MILLHRGTYGVRNLPKVLQMTRLRYIIFYGIQLVTTRVQASHTSIQHYILNQVLMRFIYTLHILSTDMHQFNLCIFVCLFYTEIMNQSQWQYLVPQTLIMSVWTYSLLHGTPHLPFHHFLQIKVLHQCYNERLALKVIYNIINITSVKKGHKEFKTFIEFKLADNLPMNLFFIHLDK